MHEHTVLRIVTKLIVTPIMLFGLYVQFHGEYSPGGGFQAGVIFAAAIILYAMIFGLTAARRAVSPAVLRVCGALGVLIFAGVGTACMLAGGHFLDYDALIPSSPIKAQHYGMIAVEFGVGLSVVSVILAIFYVFAGRGRRRL